MLLACLCIALNVVPCRGLILFASNLGPQSSSTDFGQQKEGTNGTRTGQRGKRRAQQANQRPPQARRRRGAQRDSRAAGATSAHKPPATTGDASSEKRAAGRHTTQRSRTARKVQCPQGQLLHSPKSACARVARGWAFAKMAIRACLCITYRGAMTCLMRAQTTTTTATTTTL